ncbi:MAG: hypothetical protein C0617_00335 [Desulfuromonas sp.]|uniref:TOBE domain-containing protein n=1 Tax=Desulfuromonas sp. TaxID=892 RepID=UPI000CCA31EA|nr:TOBE domain-containing protein [Desulfuromonas sp.]PLX86691.1 MAG: hypothetical protein C0617_00335 [Desulfuromonas sp.]
MNPTENGEVPIGPEWDGLQLQGNADMELLDAICSCGSINRAAKMLGLSYRAAWERIDRLNNLSRKPLLERSTGGRGGGGTQLTRAGKEFLERYRLLHREYQRMLSHLEGGAARGQKNLALMKRLNMQFSARNAWCGEILEISQGQVNAQVAISLQGPAVLSAMVTRQSLNSLALAPGREVLALAKASSVIIGLDLRPEQVGAQNLLTGQVRRIVAGPAQADVTLELPGGSTASGVVSLEGLECLGLAEGDEACALIKATDILLATVQ